MLRLAWLNSAEVRVVAVMAVLALGVPQATAQVKPFKVSGAGIAPDGIPLPPELRNDPPAFHWAVGKGTYLGNYYGEGYVQTDNLTGPNTANFKSAVPFVFVAANGDKLACTYGDTANGAAQPGHVTLHDAGNGMVSAVWVAEFNPVPAQCTGRFAKVIGGSFLMIAESEPFVLGAMDPVGYSWTGKGTLHFKTKTK